MKLLAKRDDICEISDWIYNFIEKTKYIDKPKEKNDPYFKSMESIKNTLKNSYDKEEIKNAEKKLKIQKKKFVKHIRILNMIVIFWKMLKKV